MAVLTGESGIGELAEKLWKARHVTVLTDAGISAESGVPTFRGEGGLWKRFRAVDLATPEAFTRDPELVWEFYTWRRELIAPLVANPGHMALAEMERRLGAHFTLITQNIDGLHHKAGNRNVIELHGNLWHVRCTRCGRVSEDRTPLPRLPACGACGSLLRPHVVWFGETLAPQVLHAAFEAVKNCDLMMVIGTSGTVQPAASMGSEAKASGATVAEINLAPTLYSDDYTISILGKSGEILPRLL